MGAAVWNGLHTRDAWYSFAHTCHGTALSHCVRPEAAPTHTVPVMVCDSDRATRKDILSRISTPALTIIIRRGLHQPSHRRHGRPRATPQHQRPRWVSDLRNPSTREHLWHPAIRSVNTNAPLAIAHLVVITVVASCRRSFFLLLKLPLLSPRAVSAKTAFPPHVRILICASGSHCQGTQVEPL